MRLDRPFASFLLALLFLKLAILALEPIPKFFFGDSWCYLETAAFGWIPPDRSFTYGFFIRATTWLSGSLWPLMTCQMLASILSAALAGQILRRHLGVRPAIAYSLGCICALEPIQLLYERYVMTETFSLSFFALHLLAILHYLRGRNLLTLFLAHLLGTALISLRISFLPITLVNALLAPILAFYTQGGRQDRISEVRRTLQSPPVRRPGWTLACSVHLIVSLGLVLSMHAGYKRSFSALSGSPPGYNAAGGYFLLAAWAPVVQPEDFPDPRIRAQIFDGLPFDIRDRSLRNHQLFEYGGLVDRIRNALPGPEGNRAAQATALNALKRDPLGIVVLWLQTMGDYFRPSVLTEKIRDDLAVGQVSWYQRFLEVHGERYSIPRAETQPWTLTKWYYENAIPWYWLLLLSPALAALALVFARGHAAGTALLLSVSVCGCIYMATALSNYPIVRYLHPVGWLALCLMGPLLERALSGPSR